MNAPQRSLFTLLITVASLSIALPGLVKEERGQLFLTLSIFFLGRIVDCVNNLDSLTTPRNRILLCTEGMAGVVGSGICIFCLSIHLSHNISDSNIVKYISIGDIRILFSLSLVYIVVDLIKCGTEFYSSYVTHNKIFKIIGQKEEKR